MGDRADRGDETREIEPVVGQPAPIFSLEAVDGGTVRLADYRGRCVVLFFMRDFT